MTNYHATARLASVIDAITKRVIAKAERKSINEVVRRYRDAFENVLYDAFNGRMSQTLLVAKLAAIIESNAGDAYREGMREGGGDPETDFTKEDQSVVDDWISTQIGVLAGFAQAAVDVRSADDKDTARAAILDRVDMWVEGLNQLGMLGSLNMKGDPMLTYDGDDGEESCTECQKYKGQRHRRSWWEKKGLLERNGNENFTCGRWDNCHHNYYFDDGSIAL